MCMLHYDDTQIVFYSEMFAMMCITVRPKSTVSGSEDKLK